ncbi:MAG TPA: TlpA family protein disulfide reductase [Anaerolineae bacterium]|nr:TlpA family protein disulfide reductase [Anaerolineae bacterium]HIP71658.1 TlpA family protein disulfide reductase [Anaerolineae bacterium]
MINDFIARYGLEYPFLKDEDGSLSRNYNVFSTPTTYFINPDGIVADVLPGVMSQQWIDRNMAALKG